MRPVVYIASVPWRRDNLSVILETLDVEENEGLPVRVVCDGYGKERLPTFHPFGSAGSIDVDFIDNRGKRGAGERFRHIAHEDRDVLAIVIDDDMMIDEEYVARCEHEFYRLGAPFSWNGTQFTGAYMPPEGKPDDDVRLFILGAGTLVCPARLLYGIDADPMADALFGPSGDDEALVSWWLAHQGLKMYRPRGRSGAHSTKYQMDPRSQWCSQGGRHFRFRAELRKRGWPLVDPPPGARFVEPVFEPPDRFKRSEATKTEPFRGTVPRTGRLPLRLR